MSTRTAWKRRPGRSGSKPAHEPFYFCAADIVVLPTPFAPDTLPGFLDGLKNVSVHSIHHHFTEARLRLHLMSNDFSQWLEEEVAPTEDLSVTGDDCYVLS